MGIDLDMYRMRISRFSALSASVSRHGSVNGSVSHWKLPCCLLLYLAMLTTTVSVILCSGDIALNPGPPWSSNVPGGHSVTCPVLSLAEFASLSNSSKSLVIAQCAKFVWKI